MPVPDQADLRVGVVVPSTAPAAWIAEAVVALAATGARVAVQTLATTTRRPSGWGRLATALGGARDTPDPDIPRPLSGLTGVDIVEELTHSDVVFHVGVAAAGNSMSPEPRLGSWELLIDDDVGLQETLDNTGAVPVAVHRVGSDEVLRASWSRVQRGSPATTRARALWRAAALPSRALGDLMAGRTALDLALPSSPQPLSGRTAVSGSLRLAGRNVTTGLRRLLARNEWFVACSIDAGQQPLPDLGHMTRLCAPKDRFWADPFPVVDGDQAVIFVEEWPYALGRGVLAAIELQRDGTWRRLGAVLEHPWHLSHPFLFRWQGERWLLPESSAAGTLELYRCVDYPLHWERECVVMQDVRLVDATLHEGADRWWLFANIGDDRVSTHEELHLFYADTPLGPWTPHPANPVVSDPRSARPAGSLFESGGLLYRPAQDCGVRYGRSLVINEVLELTPTDFRECPQMFLEPGALAGANRLHTLNRDDWLTVVDGHRDNWWPR
ncbi:MAG TPA: hypothetical protein QGF95_06270 [Candidatus Latescibacteria bacterium]|jgi:hypothetical protein|nr:hypothetical protein [Gemmatimonadaceae bacterium]MDP6014613.1 hypothetical protein [Candidatus Latescibacterota bacterium]HJP30141.1 hypothetical protein [Candidatus Latescibacterota bacterium]